mgnify:CR=1 FL=1
MMNSEPLPSSTGGYTSRKINAGTIRNSGVDLALNFNVAHAVYLHIICSWCAPPEKIGTFTVARCRSPVYRSPVRRPCCLRLGAPFN